MSYTLGFELSCWGADFPRVRDFATVVTREQSLIDLGYDLTDPEQGDENEKRLGVATDYFVGEEHHVLCWSEFSGASKPLDIDVIIDRIVQAFPNVEFIYSYFHDGPLSYEEYRKGSEREEVVSFALDVAVKDEAAFQVLAREAQAFVERQETLLEEPLFGGGLFYPSYPLFDDGPVNPPFVVFPMKRIRISQMEKTVEDFLRHLWDLVQTPLYCVIVREDQGTADCDEKAVFSGRELIWERIDYLFIMIGNTPDERVLDFLFFPEEGSLGKSNRFFFDPETGIRTSFYPEDESDGLEKASVNDDEDGEEDDLPW